MTATRTYTEYALEWEREDGSWGMLPPCKRRQTAEHSASTMLFRDRPQNILKRQVTVTETEWKRDK